MSNYNRNANTGTGTGSYNKQSNGGGSGYQKKTFDKPKAQAEGETVKPRYNLVFKAAGDEKFTQITGIFENLGEDASIRSNSVKIKTDISIPAGATLFLFDNNNKPK